jgi:hypothetical protein
MQIEINYITMRHKLLSKIGLEIENLILSLQNLLLTYRFHTDF